MFPVELEEIYERKRNELGLGITLDAFRERVGRRFKQEWREKQRANSFGEQLEEHWFTNGWAFRDYALLGIHFVAEKEGWRWDEGGKMFIGADSRPISHEEYTRIRTSFLDGFVMRGIRYMQGDSEPGENVLIC